MPASAFHFLEPETTESGTGSMKADTNPGSGRRRLIAASIAGLALSVAGLAAAAHGQADEVRRLPKPVRTYAELKRETRLTKPAAIALGEMAVDVAGKQWPTTVSFRCYASGGHVVSGEAAPAPTKVFDNVYFVGSADVSSWAIDTPEGIILIDAQTTEEDAQRYVIDGLRKLGLDSTRIKYILITHEHFDHYGGASLIKRLSGARIAMSEPAWAALEKMPASTKSPIPARDMVINDGDVVTLGGERVTSVFTPGHTPGTFSFIFPVTAKGVVHNAALWGGNGFPQKVKDRKIFLQAIDHFAEATSRENVDVELAIHGDTDNLNARLARVGKGGPNPFLVGRDAYLRYEEVYRLCSRARMEERGDFGS